MKKITIFVISVILLANTNAHASEIVFDLSENKSGYAALRSVFIPGWGQSGNKQPTKAWITLGLFAVSLGGAIYFNNEATEKYNKYEAKGLINDSLYDDYKNYKHISEGCIISAAIFYIYGIADAYFTAKKDMKSSKFSAFNFYYDPDNDGLSVNYKYRI